LKTRFKKKIGPVSAKQTRKRTLTGKRSQLFIERSERGGGGGGVGGGGAGVGGVVSYFVWGGMNARGGKHILEKSQFDPWG